MVYIPIIISTCYGCGWAGIVGQLLALSGIMIFVGALTLKWSFEMNDSKRTSFIILSSGIGLVIVSIFILLQTFK